MVVRHDNLKAAVVRACFFDPDSHDVYLAFAAALGLHPAADAPRNPKENGKQERSGGYVKTNALKGRRFDSLEAQNAFLRHWNRTIARLRIHGTTRRQVWTHFVEVEQRALQPLAGETFPCFASGERHGPQPTATSKSPERSTGALAAARQRLRVRWDAHLVRVFHGDTLVMVHARVAGRRVCRPAPARRRPRPGSKRTSIDSSANVRAWALRSSSGPTPRSPPEASAPFASFKASSA